MNRLFATAFRPEKRNLTYYWTLVLNIFEISETIIYNGIINRDAASPWMMNEISTSPMRINLPSFPLNFRLLNLRDNNGSRVTIRTDKITVYKSNAIGESVNDFSR